MVNIMIIHGTGGNPEGNWFPWLKVELEKLGHMVFVPKFPTPENQSLNNWFEVLKEYHQYFNEETIVVGHSLGVAFLLSVLERLNSPIKSAYFIAGFTGLLGNKEFDDLNSSFVVKKFDWEAIRNNCNNFCVINSDNDPYVPLSQGKFIADSLEVDLVIIKEAGHINFEFGYEKFDFLLDKLKEELS